MHDIHTRLETAPTTDYSDRLLEMDDLGQASLGEREDGKARLAKLLPEGMGVQPHRGGKVEREYRAMGHCRNVGVRMLFQHAVQCRDEPLTRLCCGLGAKHRLVWVSKETRYRPVKPCAVQADDIAPVVLLQPGDDLEREVQMSGHDLRRLDGFGLDAGNEDVEVVGR